MTKAMLIATLLFSAVSFAQAPTEAPKPAEAAGTVKAEGAKAEGKEKKKHHKKDKKGAGLVKKANNKG